MKKKHDYEKLIIKLLEEAIPLQKHKVLWRFVSNLKDYGSCSSPVRGVITISINSKQHEMIDTIIHEYAHALDFDRNGLMKEHHSAEWGKCYAEVYRTYVKLLEQNRLERKKNHGRQRLKTSSRRFKKI